jgi:hypothetical protein
MTSEGGGEGAAACGITATRHVNLQPSVMTNAQAKIGQIADLKQDVTHNMSANRFRRKIFMLTSTVRSLCAPKVHHRSVCARV